MVDCIVCRKPLSDALRSMNKEYHPECSKFLVKEEWYFFDKKTLQKDDKK